MVSVSCENRDLIYLVGLIYLSVLRGLFSLFSRHPLVSYSNDISITKFSFLAPEICTQHILVTLNIFIDHSYLI